MKQLFDNISAESSRLVTKTYSTSFSLGILFLDSRIRKPIYNIYGFVRFADEIVDSFHGFNKEKLLSDFRKDTEKAIRDGISLNPILNSFQEVVNHYRIRREWIDAFFDSMEMDLKMTSYNLEKYNKYILGSAESVGLMCLHVFTDRDEEKFNKLKPYAMKLGAAFQKVNFLRDLKADHSDLGRTYFPGVDLKKFTFEDKAKIEEDIENDFDEALKGIKMLPRGSRKGVYLAYYYYTVLFKKIKRLPPHRILNGRIRIHNAKKVMLMFESGLRQQFNLL